MPMVLLSPTNLISPLNNSLVCDPVTQTLSLTWIHPLDSYFPPLSLKWAAAWPKAVSLASWLSSSCWYSWPWMPPAATEITVACSCPLPWNSLARKSLDWKHLEVQTQVQMGKRFGRRIRLWIRNSAWELNEMLSLCVCRELKLKGLSTPRGSMQVGGVQTKDSVQLTEVTCDKASLTKHEWVALAYVSQPYKSIGKPCKRDVSYFMKCFSFLFF